VANLSFPTGGGGPMTIAVNNDNRYYVDFYKSSEIAVVEGPVNH
jgi:hypothetical protein